MILALTQSLILASGQVSMKIGLARMDPFSWTKSFFASAFLNWPFALSGLLFGSSALLWMYIVKHFPLSVAYPLVSMSYVFGMLASMVVFHEEVSLSKWIGVLLIMGGCALIAK